jgi:hypothetical protein
MTDWEPPVMKFRNAIEPAAGSGRRLSRLSALEPDRRASKRNAPWILGNIRTSESCVATGASGNRAGSNTGGPSGEAEGIVKLSQARAAVDARNQAFVA